METKRAVMMERKGTEGASVASGNKTPRVSRQFWQAGEFLPEADNESCKRNEQPGLDHARLHPRFLHSNATSHKWALGALVELLDNSMDEVTAGCSYVSVDKVNHPMEGDQNPMLLVEDNGGGMDPSTIRNCMSFGFSLKHGKKMIGQYGNGFKTSTMRLGADAMVLTKSTSAQSCSVGLLSYTFLTETNSQDVVVPIVDYTLQDRKRSTRGDENEWKSKLSMICEWGPFSNEAEIWQQLDNMPSQGTRVYIWNLWQTSDNLPELDFVTDEHDVRLRGHEDDHPEASGRKKKLDEGMKRCHAYRHSLRSYVSMLYLQWPERFQITVRGQQVVPVPVTAGMKHVAVYDYRPRSLPKDESGTGPIVVPVYVGFAVEAPDTSVSGFCVYHRNRLIKPFWKVYTSASSVGRGVIGFLQVDFVEPAHDKQDFENTPPLQKLEKYLKRQVPHYWRTKSHLVGYQDHVPATKTDVLGPQLDAQSLPKVEKTVGIIDPVLGSEERELNESMTTEAADGYVAPVKRPTACVVTKPTTTGSVPKTRSGAVLTEEAKAKVTQKTPSKCMSEMQQHISQLQQSVQEFCNSYEIKEDAQLVLGRIFGMTMCRVLDPARELKRMCAAQIKGHRQALLFIAKSKTEGNLTGTVPQFIQAEMKAMGLDLKNALEVEDVEMPEIEAPTTQKQSSPVTAILPSDSQPMDLTQAEDEPVLVQSDDKANGADTPDTVVSASQEPKSKAEVEDLIIPSSHEEGITATEVPARVCRWMTQQEEMTRTVEPSVDRSGGGRAKNQDLAQIGLSVVEKFLKTKPAKLGVVQLGPSSLDAQKRGFVSGGSDGPMEIVNLSEDVETTTCPPPKRQKHLDQQKNGEAVEIAAEDNSTSMKKLSDS